MLSSTQKGSILLEAQRFCYYYSTSQYLPSISCKHDASGRFVTLLRPCSQFQRVSVTNEFFRTYLRLVPCAYVIFFYETG